MNGKKFSNAMSKLDSKYIDEALNYKKKTEKNAKKPGWIKWGAIAACLAVALAIGIPYSVQYFYNDRDGGNAGYIVATKMTFKAKIVEVQENALLVEPLEGTEERELATTILIPIDETIGELNTVEYLATAQAGDIVQIGYLKEDSDIRKGTIAVYEIVPVETEHDGNPDGYSTIPNHQTSEEEGSEQGPEAPIK